MIERVKGNGYFVAVDGPNGVGKSTLINAIKEKLVLLGYVTVITKEPTNSQLGMFLREYAEEHSGIEVACLVAADRYKHLTSEVIPALEKGYLVITDRYILSSLILQQMDGVSNEYILDLNSQIIKPDLQLVVFAEEEILQRRLAERKKLTRFEANNQSGKELYFMKKGIKELRSRNVNIMEIVNNDNLMGNVDKVVSYIIEHWR